MYLPTTPTPLRIQLYQNGTNGWGVEIMFSRRILKVMLTSFVSIIFSSMCSGSSWNGLRTSGAGTQGWQALICDSGSGWRSCELPVNITLTASPASVVALNQSTTVTATVTDYYGVAIAGNVLNWTTTDGTISPSQTTTNASGSSSITLTSSRTLGGTSVSARTAENDGIGSLWVPFIDSFVAYPSTYTAWANNGGVYSCTAWSPDPSTVASGTWFTQTASCYQNYYRYRQDRQQSQVTGIVINAGGLVTEYTTSIVGVSQGAIGTKVVTPPAPVCWSSGNHGGGVNQGVFFDAGAMDESLPPDTALTLYYNGNTGLSMPSTSSSMVYNGMILTAGAKFYVNNIGRNRVVFNYQVCQVPL